MESNPNKKYFLLLLPYFLFAQGVFVFYKIVPAFMTLYTSEPAFLILNLFGAIVGILAIVGGFGIIFKKQWGIILYWIMCVIPGVIPAFRIPGITSYMMIVINVVFVSYLSVSSWKEWGKAHQ